jgi:hypothetical protein
MSGFRRFVNEIIAISEEEEPARCYLVFYCTYERLTCFEQHYANHQELSTMYLITTWTALFLGCWWLAVRSMLAGQVSLAPDDGNSAARNMLSLS